MADVSEPFKQSLPSIGLSIERGTVAAPADGCFYVLLNGEIRGKHRSLGKAQIQYKALRDECGWMPPTLEQRAIDRSKMAVESYMDALEGYWSSSSQHRRAGGKGR